MIFPESLGLANPYKFGSQSGSARIAILIAIAVAILAGLFFLPVKDYVVAMLEWTKGLGMWGPVVFVAFYVVACVLFLPGSVITLGAAFIFGLLLGFVTVSIGSTLGACAAFLVGRTIGRDWVSRKVQGSAKFAAIDEAVGKEGFKIVFLLRLSPVFPFNLLNYALGLTRVPFRHYALASWIGMIPGTLMYCYLGSAARSLTEVAAGQVVEGGLAGQILFWAGLVATIAVAALITRIAGKSIKEAGLAADTGQVLATGNPSPAVAVSTEVQADVTGETSPQLVEIAPFDEHNRQLVQNVHPSDWVSPEPASRYNLVVIGAGTAGLVTAAGAAGVGAKVALVERHLLGGDCLNVGCVPSKTLIRSSRIAAELRTAADFGINVPENFQVDFGKVMERMRRVRAGISHHDSAERFRDLGVDVFLGSGRFSGPDTVEVGGKTLRFKRAVIATGARAVHPRLDGLADAGFLTNETVFSLTERPKRLGVIGAGPIGCEMAQTFQRLGSQVFLFHRNAHILDREDADAAEIIQQKFIEEGIELELSCNLKSVESKNGEKIIHFETMGRTDSVAVDEILVGAGRAPNVEGLNLEGVGVKYDSRAGIVVNDNLQTTNPLIYAAGDICMAYKFTHAADAAARIVIQNTLFKGSKKLSALTVPWCTYTDPEIAHVGLYEKDFRDKGLEPATFVRHLRDVDRAIADGEEEGFVKIHVQKGTDKILGATIVASHAGDMISEITVAMAGKVGLGAIANAIHPYPTQAEAIKQAGDAYNRTRLTPFVKNLFHKWLAWTR